MKHMTTIREAEAAADELLALIEKSRMVTPDDASCAEIARAAEATHGSIRAAREEEDAATDRAHLLRDRRIIEDAARLCGVSSGFIRRALDNKEFEISVVHGHRQIVGLDEWLHRLVS